MEGKNVLPVGAALFVLLLAISSPVADPHSPARPRPIRSVVEIEAAIADSVVNGETMKYANDLELMWDGRRDLLVKAVYGANSYLARAAMFGLAAIGDEESARILRPVLVDTSLALERRLVDQRAALEEHAEMPSADAYYRGVSLAGLGRHGEAESLFQALKHRCESALRQSPRAALYHWAALACHGLGENSLADRYLRLAVQTDPSYRGAVIFGRN